MSRLNTLCALFACLSFAHAAAQQDVRFGFESGGLDGWTIVEGEFDTIVTNRAEFHHNGQPYNKEGECFLSTLETSGGKPDDRFTGIIESSVFVLSAPDMTFLVGGGNHPDTYVALCTLDGAEVMRASGVNDQVMQAVTWHAPELVGKPLFLRIVDGNTGGWGHITFDAFSAQGDVDADATQKHFAHAKELRAMANRRAEIQSRMATLDVTALRASVEQCAAEFGDAYPAGRSLPRILEMETRVQQWQQMLESGDAAALDVLARELDDALSLRREALLSNPLLTRQPILFVVRKQYKPDHHNTATIFQPGEINHASFEGGAALKTLNVATGEVATLLAVPEGIVRDPELYFDGSRIIVSLRRNKDDFYHIYELNADGTGLRALTSAPGVSDIDPLYLADGDIMFSSTREPKYCMCNRHIMANLFRMEPDGANIHQLGKSTLFEGHGALMSDGRVMYYRWEYVDRNFGDAQGLWTVNPDGTNHAVYYGNNTNSPGAVIDARPVPGTQQVICTFSSCHDRPWGALALLDRRRGVDGMPAVVRTWPASAVDLVGVGDFDTYIRVMPKYEDPYPLSGRYFLCSRMTGNGEEMGIYLVDTFGNETLVYAEAPGCFDPMPLAPRPRPLAIPPRRTYDAPTGRFYVADVYEGTHMAGVERGSVRWLRVVESPEKRFWSPAAWNGQGQEAPAMNWHDFCNKRILGTVPVEPDGSANVEVPADTFVFFQLLDENGMMVQSMRSGTMIQPGEVTGCVGCHENRLSSPPASDRTPLAIQRPASTLDAWYGPPRLFNYLAEVQPVFDNHCVKCHDFGKKGGEKLVLAGDRDLVFNASYNELWRKGHTGAVGAGPAETRPAKSWGSHASRLVQMIRKGHGDVKLSPEEFDRITTWIDLNAPYYPEYSSAYPDGLAGRAPLTNEQADRLSALTQVTLRDLMDHGRSQGPQVSFDRPEASPCLAQFNDKTDPRYLEALEIIRAGAAALAARPEADMPGYEPCAIDLARDEKYNAREAAEQRIRAALANGDRVYDPGIGTGQVAIPSGK